MAAISLASLAAAPGPVARQPTGKWVVNFDASQCIATRNYGSAEDSLYLVLKAPPLGDVLQIGILRTGYVRNAAQIDGEIFFDENSPVQTNLLEYAGGVQGGGLSGRCDYQRAVGLGDASGSHR